MINEENLIKYLEYYGLDQYEAKVYIALLARGSATASELSDISGIPYTRIYDAINNLESKGLILRIPGRPMKFSVIHPKLALKNLRHKLVLDFEKRIKKLEDFENLILKDLEQIYRKASKRVYEAIKTVEGRMGIHSAISMFLRQVEKGEAFFVISRNTYERIKIINYEDMEFAREKGLNINVYIVSKSKDPELETLLIEAPEKTANIIIIGEDNVLLFESVPDDTSLESEYDTGVIIKNSKIAYILKYLIRKCGSEHK